MPIIDKTRMEEMKAEPLVLNEFLPLRICVRCGRKEPIPPGVNPQLCFACCLGDYVSMREPKELKE